MRNILLWLVGCSWKQISSQHYTNTLLWTSLELDLKNNPLQCDKRMCLIHLQTSLMLDLKNNPLQCDKRMCLTHLQTSLMLDLKNNPLQCDKRMCLTLIQTSLMLNLKNNPLQCKHGKAWGISSSASIICVTMLSIPV